MASASIRSKKPDRKMPVPRTNPQILRLRILTSSRSRPMRTCMP